MRLAGRLLCKAIAGILLVCVERCECMCVWYGVCLWCVCVGDGLAVCLCGVVMCSVCVGGGLVCVCV